MIDIGALLAQASQPAPTPPSGGTIFWAQIFPLLLIVAVFYFLLFRPQKRERDKHAQMLAAMKRGDRVQTIGGIYGTIVDVRESEVTLKVDETNNVKIRMNRAAIKEILRDSGPPAAPPPAEKK